MTVAEPCGLSQDRQARCLDQLSPLPIMPTEAMVHQAEVDAAYLAVEAARADPRYQVQLQAKAAEARERAYRLRAAVTRPMPYETDAVPVDIGAHDALGRSG
jgi:3'-phosphoadenosine 5'-phosphosulfate sulfotransferase